MLCKTFYFFCLLVVTNSVCAQQHASESVAYDSILLSKKVIPSVVKVYAYRNQHELLVPFDDDFLEKFFFGKSSQVVPPEQQSSGTGFIIESNADDSIIVTCNHVVHGSNKIEVGLNNNQVLEAELLYADSNDDIAFLKIKKHDLPALEAENRPLNLGSPILIAGNIFGHNHISVFPGFVSNLQKSLGDKIVIETDTSIGPGASGGPLVNAFGNVAGMAFAVLSKVGVVSYSVPISLIDYHYRTGVLGQEKAWWGIEVQQLTPDIAEAKGLKGFNGVIVTAVDKKSPLSNMLKVGDVITAVDGKPISSPVEFYFYEKISLITQDVNLNILKGDHKKEIIFKPIKALKQKNTVLAGKNNIAKGAVFEESKHGVVVEKSSESGVFQKGDLVLSVNGVKILKPQDIELAFNSNTHGYSVTLNRGGGIITQQVMGY